MESCLVLFLLHEWFATLLASVLSDIVDRNMTNSMVTFSHLKLYNQLENGGTAALPSLHKLLKEKPEEN